MTFSPENKENSKADREERYKAILAELEEINCDLKAAHETFERWNESRTDQRGGGNE